MSSLLKIIALSHGVQSCRVGYKAEYIIARCESAAKACETYDNPEEVALRFAELYGSAIVNYETDEAMARCVADSAAKMDMEWYKMFRDLLPKESPVVRLMSEEDSDKVLKLIDYDNLKAENDELKASVEELTKGRKAETEKPVDPPVASELSEAKSDPPLASDAKTIDLSQVPIAVLGVTKALKTALLAIGCQTVADVVKRHAEKPLESELGIGEKSQQMILEAIAKLG